LSGMLFLICVVMSARRSPKVLMTLLSFAYLRISKMTMAPSCGSSTRTESGCGRACAKANSGRRRLTARKVRMVKDIVFIFEKVISFEIFNDVLSELFVHREDQRIPVTLPGYWV